MNEEAKTKSVNEDVVISQMTEKAKELSLQLRSKTLYLIEKESENLDENGTALRHLIGAIGVELCDIATDLIASAMMSAAMASSEKDPVQAVMATTKIVTEGVKRFGLTQESMLMIALRNVIAEGSISSGIPEKIRGVMVSALDSVINEREKKALAD